MQPRTTDAVATAVLPHFLSPTTSQLLLPLPLPLRRAPWHSLFPRQIRHGAVHTGAAVVACVHAVPTPVVRLGQLQRLAEAKVSYLERTQLLLHTLDGSALPCQRETVSLPRQGVAIPLKCLALLLK